MSLLVERDTACNLEVYDLSLQAVMEGLEHPGVRELPPDLRRMVLFDRSATAKDMGSLLVLDEAGNVVIDSKSESPRRVNAGDRDYFKVHRDSPNVGLYVSHPFSMQHLVRSSNRQKVSQVGHRRTYHPTCSLCDARSPPF